MSTTNDYVIFIIYIYIYIYMYIYIYIFIYIYIHVSIHVSILIPISMLKYFTTASTLQIDFIYILTVYNI